MAALDRAEPKQAKENNLTFDSDLVLANGVPRGASAWPPAEEIAAEKGTTGIKRNQHMNKPMALAILAVGITLIFFQPSSFTNSRSPTTVVL
ncbi:MAG: hypothetical protein ABI651_19705, partial [Verrucomicrobiota bacterium]